MMIRVANDFSETPGPRSRDEGKDSGQQFLEELLLPKYEEAKKHNEHLIIDLDGTEGYATSFLESAFGGLARKYGAKEILDTIKFKSIEEPYLIGEIMNYIRGARNS
jgi:folate-dependent tRNA-U54 methylase TrmFO/GidA